MQVGRISRDGYDQRSSRSATGVPENKRAERRLFAAYTWAAQRRTFVQTFQFWRCLTNQVTHHPGEEFGW
jgi:hypothetical protein